jgi:dTDP-4-dehydrorhamnose 3,5-epimerase-like enzyme
MSNLSKCSKINFKQKKHSTGHLTFAQYSDNFPFLVKRFYILNKLSHHSIRGSHAHKKLKQIFICVKGSFQIDLCDGLKKKSFKLNDITKGLYVHPGIWRDLKYFSKDTIIFVLASHIYSETDYIRNYEDFLNFVKKKK